jgi:thiamine biosynthesis lipoprotein
MCLLFCVLTLGGFAQEKRPVTVHKTLKLMGTRFDITVVADNEDIGYINIDEATSEIKRIENLISAWNPDSETSLINRNAGVRPVKVDPELFRLIERAKQISELTDGAFDISYASMDELWKFDGTMDRMPTEGDLQRSVAEVGYRKRDEDFLRCHWKGLRRR